MLLRRKNCNGCHGEPASTDVQLQERIGKPAVGVALSGILLVAIFNSTVLAVAVNSRYASPHHVSTIA